ncbi:MULTISPECIES: MFS transporter [unclassified Pseudoclavibacter]|uniref:MFS transporter n=1 Tax=unclassified Pseudoclavibacter TaxID=2615177 RepID=UPI0013010374|nr:MULTISPECIES: MFS transporter [unclassified Pseudoclavibacter]KAB1647303.1 MHS family MFS transporter [Pseudoclavibacter sp. CFCC 14310]KAB1662704.1 MHS family MFS transporter [Pseudoclavibacter sp. CFCC 13611]
MSVSAPAAPKKGLRQVVLASMAGTIVEWYEFFLYATAATLVFNKVFFPPSEDPYAPIIAAFVTYAVGFVARPLGGIVFAHFGDRYGRKHLLQVAIIMVGASTFLMGCLPTFATVGYWAPALLVALRFIQGIAVGGEWGGAVLLVAEHAPAKSRGFWASWPQAALPLGNLLATIVLLVLSASLSPEAFLSWGWRIGFWLSVVIVAVGYYVRTKISDAPIFQETQRKIEQEDEVRYGVFEVLKRYPRGVLTAMGLRFAENILYYMVVTFSITYLSVWVKMDTSSILGLMFFAHVFQFVIVPLTGALTDRVGRKPVYIAGAVLTGVWPFVAFPMFNTAAPLMVILAIILGLFVHGLMYAGQPAIMSEMFPTRMRYAGVSFGYQVTSIVAGSVAPIIATALLGQFSSWVPIALYLVGAALITLIAAVSLRETKGITLEEIDRRDHERHIAPLMQSTRAEATPGA